MRLGWVCSIAALGLVSPLAEAASDRVQLVWQRAPAAATCPTEAEIGRRVAARLGRDPFVDPAERVVEARVDRVAEVWRVQIRVFDRAGNLVASRDPIESTSTDCAALSDAAVLAIALAIDPESALGPPPSPGPVQSVCPPVNCPTCPACPPPEQRSESMTMSAELRALVGLGILPNPAPGVALAAEAEPLDDVSFGLSLLYFPEVETDSGELSFGLSALELFGCTRFLSGEDAGISGCLGFQVGAVHAVPRTLRPIEPGDYLWLAATAGPRGDFRPIEPLRLSLGVSGVVPLIAHDFVVRGRPGSAYEPATVGLLGYFGVGVETP